MSEHTPVLGALAFAFLHLKKQQHGNVTGFSFNKFNLFLQNKTIGKREGNLTSQTRSLLTVIWNSNCWTGRGRLKKGGNEKKLRDTFFISYFRKATASCRRVRLEDGPEVSVPVAKLMPRFNPWGPHGGELIPQLHCKLFSVCALDTCLKQRTSCPDLRRQRPQAHIKF